MLQKIIAFTLILCEILVAICLACHEILHTDINSEGVYKLHSTRHGDYIFQSVMTITDNDKCNQVTSEGLFRIYAVKYAIERLNENRDILPNITLGYEIHDTCKNLPTGMSIGIDIIQKHKQSECRRSSDRCTAATNSGQNVAVIGAYYSFITIPLASLMSLYSIPQISYGSSSPLLSKKNLYPSFYRTLPSDRNQVDVFIEILKQMGWNYIFTIASDDDYGKQAVSYLKKEISKQSICLAGVKYIPWQTQNTERVVQETVRALLNEPKAKVVLMFGYAKGMGDVLLKEAEKSGLERFWLTSEGWNPHILNVQSPPNQLKSVLTVSLAKSSIPSFSAYLQQKFSNITDCDGWIKKFVESKSSCSFNRYSKRPQCDPDQTEIFNQLLLENPEQVSNLLDAVEALALGLELTIKEKCVNVTSNTTCRPIISVDRYTSLMKNVSVRRNGKEIVSFDMNGDLQHAIYRIANVQYINGTPIYVAVGNWDVLRKPALMLKTEDIIWPQWFTALKSECAPKCEKGSFLTGKTGCCWICRECQENEISNTTNAEQCYRCPNGFRTLDKVACHPIQITFVEASTVTGGLIICISVIGALLTIFALIAFRKLKLKEPIRNTSTFLLYVSFATLIFKFLYFPLALVKPTEKTCFYKSIFENLDLIFSVALLFIHNKSSSNFVSKFLEHYRERKFWTRLIVLLIIISLQIMLIIIWKSEAKITTEETQIDTNSLDNFIQCKFDFSIYSKMLYFYPAVILALASAIAFSERKDPNQRFNEAKYLNYCCLSSCILMIAELLVLQAVKGKYLAIVLSLTLNAYGYVYIMCILMPKLYYSIILNVLVKSKTKREAVNKAYVSDEHNDTTTNK